MALTADERIAADLRRRAERAKPGTRLPSVRDLSTEHRASPVTVQRALARVAAEGVVVAYPGAARSSRTSLRRRSIRPTSAGRRSRSEAAASTRAGRPHPGHPRGGSHLSGRRLSGGVAPAGWTTGRRRGARGSQVVLMVQAPARRARGPARLVRARGRRRCHRRGRSRDVRRPVCAFHRLPRPRPPRRSRPRRVPDLCRRARLGPGGGARARPGRGRPRRHPRRLPRGDAAPDARPRHRAAADLREPARSGALARTPRACPRARRAVPRLRHRGRVCARPLLRTASSSPAHVRRPQRARAVSPLADEVDGARPPGRRPDRPRGGTRAASVGLGRQRFLRLGTPAADRARGRDQPGMAASPASAAEGSSCSAATR